MKIDFNLIKEIRETTDWLLAFPEKLIDAVMKPQECFLRRRERIQRLKEIVEIRVIGKALQSVYLLKGSLMHWINEMQSGGDPKNAVHIRELFRTLAGSIANVRQAVIDTSISNTSLGSEAAMFLSRTELAYQKISQLPDEALLNDRAIAEIAEMLERIIQAASTLLKQVDEHRKLLDHTYGD